MSQFINNIIERARQNRKRIVLPEGSDIRVITAAKMIRDMDFADVILLGNNEEIDRAKGDIDLSRINIIDPLTSDKKEEYINNFYELRKEKGVTLDIARETLKINNYFATMMVKMGDADGVVSGAIHSTADTLRPALQILKTKQGTSIVSSFFVMVVPNCEYGENGAFIFSDCGLIENPTAEQLAEIAISSSKSCKQLLNVDPNIAMLSYSTKGSANSELVDKVVTATNIVKQKSPDLNVDGEMQLDAAIVPSVGEKKAPGSNVAGKANTIIFPDLNAGNIGYKLVERLAKAEAYGPITQGIAKSVNDLSRGCKSEDIVGVVAITCIQACE